MGFDWLTILIAFGFVFAAWKIIKGMIKFGVIAVIIAGAGFLYLQGGVA